MSKLYSSSNKIQFTSISEKYKAPQIYRGKLSIVHGALISYVCSNYVDRKKYRQKIVDALNILTYCVMNNELPNYSWNSRRPLENIPKVDMKEVEGSLGDLFLEPDAIEWDVTPSINAFDVDIESTISTESSISQPSVSISIDSSYVDSTGCSSCTVQPVEPSHEAPKKRSRKKSASKPIDFASIPEPIALNNGSSHATVIDVVHSDIESLDSTSNSAPTPKEDLYIQPPKFPSIDTSKPWIAANISGDSLVIYTTLPEIPTCQNEISVTTDVNRMTDSELMRLYPNRFIQTRSQHMYERFDGIDYDEELGCIIPIEGFSREQVLDNIIRYPHLYKLKKVGASGQIENFVSTIEIDGELIPIDEAWDDIPESSIIPRDSEFVKEYVIRRYLLERDSGLDHKYKMYGVLEPFLTLFMPCTDYIRRGYKDTLEIVKRCVTSRVHYKQSRNPILKRIEENRV